MAKDAEAKSQDEFIPSSEQGTQPSGTKGKLYSEAEVQALLGARHSKLDARIAQLERELRKAKITETTLAETQSEVERLTGELGRVKGEFAKKDPDFKSVYQTEEQIAEEKRRLKAERAKLEREKAEMFDDVREAKIQKHERSVRAAAKEAGVSEELLLSIIPEPYEGMDIERVASRLPKASTKSAEVRSSNVDENITPWNDWNPDTGQTSGGAREATDKALQDAADRGDMDAYARLRKQQDKT